MIWVWSIFLVLLTVFIFRNLIFHPASTDPAGRALNRTFPHTSLDRWIGIYSIAFVASAAANYSPAATPTAVFQFAGYIVCYYAAVHAREKEHFLGAVSWSLLLGAIAVAVYGLLQWPQGTPAGTSRPCYYLLANYSTHTNFSALLEMAIPAGAALVFYSQKGSLKLSATAGTLSLLPVILIAQSKGGWLALVCAAAVIYAVKFVGSSRSYKILATLAAALAFAVIYYFAGDLIVARFLDLGITDLRSIPRWLTWEATIKMIWDNPLFGVGPGLFKHEILAYRPVELLRWPPYAYNHILQIVSEIGLISIPAIIGFAWCVAKQLISTFRSQEGKAGVLKSGFAAAVLILALHDLTDFNLLVPLNASIFCLFLGFIQPVPPINRQVGALLETIKRSLLFACGLVVLIGAFLIGVSDACMRLSSSPAVFGRGQSLERRLEWANRSLMIYPWNAKAEEYRAEILSDLASNESNPDLKKHLMSRSVESWERLILLLPACSEYRWDKAVAMIKLNGGVADKGVLYELDKMVRARSGSPWPVLFSSAKLALLHSPSGSEGERIGLKWLRQYIDAAPMYSDRVFALLLNHYSDVQKVAAFADGSRLGRGLLMDFLARKSRWREYASLDASAHGLTVTKNLSAVQVKALLGDTSAPTWTGRTGLLKDSLQYDLPFETRGAELVLGMNGESAAGAYVRVWLDDRMIASIYLDGRVPSFYWLKLPGKGLGRLRLESPGADKDPQDPSIYCPMVIKLIGHAAGA